MTTNTLWCPELSLIDDIQLAERPEASDSMALTLVFVITTSSARLTDKTQQNQENYLWQIGGLYRQIHNVQSLWQLRKK